MEFEREHDLPYSPEQIWAVLGDFENHRIWNPYVRIERLAEDPIAIRYSMRMDPHKPKFLEVSATVLSARPGEELTGALLSLALKGRTPRPDLPGGLISLANHQSYPEGLNGLFRTIAIASGNGELRASIINCVERSMTIRTLEARVDGSANDALTAMADDYRFGRWSALRSKITRFHRRRASYAGRVAAEIRRRSEPVDNIRRI
ncbi:MAG: hypothetical protein JNM03_02450 [Sphingopyxis sp.]|jgi:hypothetical protein|nr:hypothetical protein [Sphingopyxis sp.]MBL9068835.1 hypothetical protein [Sphingopyxis sp.]HEV7340543.1 hypothetical protein [Sphingopyxis sp.]